MRKIVAFLATTVMCAVTNSGIASETDMLVNKLAEKGVITPGEASEILNAGGKPDAGSVETLPAWVRNLSISGVIFADYYYNLTRGAAPANIDAFELTRLYLTVSGKVSERVNMKAVWEGNQPNNQLFVKNAFVEYAGIFPASNLRFGVIGTPWIGYEESLWKNRFMAKTFADNEGILNSADLGIGLSGSTAGKRVNYDAVAINGEGYKSPEVSKDKDYAARASIELLNGFKLHAYGQLGRATAAAVDRKRTIAGLGYQANGLSAMAYVLAATDGSTNKNGYSAWAAYQLLPGLGVVGRYDHFDPDIDVTRDSWSRIIAGVTTPLSKGIMLGVDVQTKDFEDGSQGNDQTAFYTHVGVTF
jgi:hypothetical protein